MVHSLKRAHAAHAVNHYERLKVSQDAPPEVIRAAYRALANRLQSPAGAPSSDEPAPSVQQEMMGLNAAYEALIDPMLRRDYDASLLSWQGWRHTADGAPADGEPGGSVPPDAANAADLRGAGGASRRTADSVSSNMTMLGVLVALMLLMVMAFVWYLFRGGVSAPVVDDAVIKQIAEQHSQPPAAPSAERVQAPAASVFVAVHPLDGQGLDLRPEVQMHSVHPVSEGASAN